MKLLLAFAVANPDVVTGLLLKKDKDSGKSKKKSSSSAGKDSTDTDTTTHTATTTGSWTCTESTAGCESNTQRFQGDNPAPLPVAAAGATSFVQTTDPKCKDLTDTDANKKRCIKANCCADTCDKNSKVDTASLSLDAVDGGTACTGGTAAEIYVKAAGCTAVTGGDPKTGCVDHAAPDTKCCLTTDWSSDNADAAGLKNWCKQMDYTDNNSIDTDITHPSRIEHVAGDNCKSFAASGNKTQKETALKAVAAKCCKNSS